MKHLKQQVWKYINDCVDEEQYLPSEEEIMEHFDSPQTPIELMENIPKVRQDYISIHALDGVEVA